MSSLPSTQTFSFTLAIVSEQSTVSLATFPLRLLINAERMGWILSDRTVIEMISCNDQGPLFVSQWGSFTICQLDATRKAPAVNQESSKQSAVNGDLDKIMLNILCHSECGLVCINIFNKQVWPSENSSSNIRLPKSGIGFFIKVDT